MVSYVALCSLCLGITLLLASRRRLVEVPRCQGSTLVWTSKAISVVIGNEFKMDAAKANVIPARGGRITIAVSWTDDFIGELKSGLIARRAFLPFIFYWLCQAQMTTNTVCQVGYMETYGLPNDLKPIIDAITIVLLLAVVNHILYHYFRHVGIQFSPVRRIAFGFISRVVEIRTSHPERVTGIFG
jgi:POT family proton-dependent oligopeptide transporter